MPTTQRQLNKLTIKAIKAATGPKRLHDGGGLVLEVKASGSRSWLFVYRSAGKRPELGLGRFPDVSLAVARAKRDEARRYLAETPPRDPKQVWKAAKAAATGMPSFGEFATEWMNENLSAYRNAKHRQQWRNSLATHAAGLWDTAIDQVSTPDVLAVLQPIWTKVPETAKRVQGRIERILNAAKAKGYFSGQNPAQWRGHLEMLLQTRKRQVKHHAALPIDDVPGFMAALAEKQSLSALALRFTILTGARASEARQAMWSEFDLDNAIWTIPAERMKGEKTHRVTLSAPAMAIISNLQDKQGGEFVFHGQRLDKPLSETSVRKTLAQLAPKGTTTHGFRSTFRDWAGDRTNFDRETAELAIAHNVGNAVERAYRRSDALEKRRRLLDAWGAFCTGAALNGDVVKLHG